MFQDREDGARQLAGRLIGRELRDPLVLGIPRGGVVTGAVLARELGADFDVLLSRKLRAPDQPELAIGAIAEDGHVWLNPEAQEVLDAYPGYVAEECRRQMAEVDWRRKLFRVARRQARLRGRSVIVTDDGIATGSTMIAALQTARAQKPHKLIAAVPVAPPERLAEVARHCDEVICLVSPEQFGAVGQFYEDFPQVEDAQAIEWLRQSDAKACLS